MLTLKILSLALLLAFPQDKPFLDESETAITAALARAKTENRRVLIVWGKNDSTEAMRVHALLAKDVKLKKLLLYEFDVVYSSQLALARNYETGVSELPAFTILGSDGARVGSESAAAADDKNALFANLEKHKAKPWVAKDLYEAALKNAKDSRKRLFLHFGAPW